MIYFLWTFVHNDIEGNEKADRASKEISQTYKEKLKVRHAQWLRSKIKSIISAYLSDRKNNKTRYRKLNKIKKNIYT